MRRASEIPELAQRPTGGTLKFDESGEFLKSYLIEHDIALLLAGYIRDLANSDEVLPRRQDLPEGTFVSGARIRDIKFTTDRRCDWQIYGSGLGWKDDWELKAQTSQTTRLFVVSHPWLTLQHPDPACMRLPELKDALSKQCAETHDLVFLDFASLSQINLMDPEYNPKKENGGLPEGHPALRTNEETKQFHSAMWGMDKLFASCMSHVIVLFGYHNVSKLTGVVANKRSYLERGWCRVELYIADQFGRIANRDDEGFPKLPGTPASQLDMKRLVTSKELAFSSKPDVEVALTLYGRCYYASKCKDIVKAIRNGYAEQQEEDILGALDSLSYSVGLDIISALDAAGCVQPFARRIADKFIGTHPDNLGYDQVLKALVSAKGDAGAVTSLCAKLEHRPIPEVAELLVDTILQVAAESDSNAVTGLLQALDQDFFTTWVRQRMVRTLGKVARPGDAAVVQGLLKIVEQALQEEEEEDKPKVMPKPKPRTKVPERANVDEIAEVSARMDAVELLGELSDPEDTTVILTLRRVMQGKQPAMRTSATSALQTIFRRKAA